MKLFGINFHDEMEKLQSNGKALLVTIIATILIMIASCIIVFFTIVKDKEQVMVPNVVGETLETALLEMQVKELYPKIQLRYSNDPSDKGRILSQDPAQGAIVKAGRRINLTVSRGVVIDQIESYVGMTIDDVKIKLQTLFAGSTPLIVLSDPMYEYSDDVDAGLIMGQDPTEGTSIIEPVTLNLIVSRGPEFEKTKVPNLVGLSVNDTLLQMTRSKLIFSFTKIAPATLETSELTKDETVAPNNRIAKVNSQQATAGEEVSIYTRIPVEFIMPSEPIDGLKYGILETTLPWYPYALTVQLEALTAEGDRYSIITFNHTGGPLTIPYAVPQNTVLILSISGLEQLRETVN